MRTSIRSTFARGAAVLAAAGALAQLAAPAHAALFSDDEARKAIIELRDTVTEQNRQEKERLDALAKRIDELANRIDAMQNGQLGATDRMDAIHNEVAQLRGATEQLSNDVGNAQKREHDRYADLDARLRKLEPADITVDGHTAQVGRDEQAAYDTAVGQFRSNDFRNAINAFSAFVARYPQSVYAPAAQFWLGSSYYAVKDFTSAVTAQLYLLEHFPDSPRVPDALLNIASSQVELNDRKNARSTLSRIVKDFPGTDQARLAQDRLGALGSAKK